MNNSVLTGFEKRKSLFLLFLFLITFFFRSPTLFNDFYDVDELSAIVQTREYLAGDIPFVDFHESKKSLYHKIFKLSYSLDEKNGWIIVHTVTIFIIFLTSFFIYLLGNYIKDFKTGALSAIFYSIFISCFNKDFLATNGEIIYNLFLAAGLYLIAVSINTGIRKRIILILFTLVMCYAAYEVKFQGIILIIFLLFFYLIYIPYHKQIISIRQILLTILIFTLAMVVLNFLGVSWIQEIFHNKMGDKLSYALAPERDFNIFNFIGRFIYRQGLFLLWHMILWIPGIYYFYSFYKNNFRFPSLEESVIGVSLIIFYMMIFGGLARFYYHYFMPAYIPLCLASSIVLLDPGKFQNHFVRRNMKTLFLIPVIFFFSWNVKDVVIKHYFPEKFYSEGKVLFWARAVLTGRYNSYLLPDPNLKEVIDYIKVKTEHGDRIFVWGNGPDIYYFSNRRTGMYTVWPKGMIYQISELYRKGDKDSIKKAESIENYFISFFNKKKPVLFIDTSGNKEQMVTEYRLLRPAVFTIPLDSAQKINLYVMKNYTYETTINDMNIYRRKKQ